MDRGASLATVHGVAKNCTRLSIHAFLIYLLFKIIFMEQLVRKSFSSFSSYLPFWVLYIIWFFQFSFSFLVLFLKRHFPSKLGELGGGEGTGRRKERKKEIKEGKAENKNKRKKAQKNLGN